MRTQWVILSSFTLVILTVALLVAPLYGYASISSSTNAQQAEDGMKNIITPAAEDTLKKQATQVIDDSIKKTQNDISYRGAADRFHDKMVGKAEKLTNYLLGLGKSYSVPLLIFSILAGAVLLVLGILIGTLHTRSGEMIRGLAIGLKVAGIIAFLLINNADTIGNKVTSLFSWIFN